MNTYINKWFWLNIYIILFEKLNIYYKDKIVFFILYILKYLKKKNNNN